jgi:hypothetical protein
LSSPAPEGGRVVELATHAAKGRVQNPLGVGIVQSSHWVGKKF